MRKRKAMLFLWIFVVYCSSLLLHAAETQSKGLVVVPTKTKEVIKVDGNLDEKAWGDAVLTEDFREFYPVYGTPLGFDTKVWMTYDKENLYFGFKCFDSEPNKIKTSIGARDNVYYDDWVGVVIDSQATRISTCELYSNPNGIQWDGVTTALNNLTIDPSPDFVYETAGKLVADGYQVEMRVPLDILRFKGGDEVRMNIRFNRNVNRLGKQCTWPEIIAGQSTLNNMITVVYKDLKKSLNLEVLPNFTFSHNKERVDSETWGKAENKANVGASLKYGVTASITAEATVNPDFSQVESDAFQVEVNERYPLFYIEKRPFFMEGLGAFDFGYVQRGLMRTSLYTRYIQDPNWATKISGTSGKVNFGVLAAEDKTPGQSLDDGFYLPEGKEAYWSMARVKYNLGSDNSVGLLYSGRYTAENKNSVFGADVQYRLFDHARFYFSYLFTSTQMKKGEKDKIGSGINTMIEYNTKHLNAWLTYERFDEDFTMYSAFLQQSNVSKVNSYFGPNLTPKLKFAPWLKRMQVYVRYSQMYDYNTKLVDTSFGTGFNFYFIKSGYFKIVLRDEKEAWLGVPMKYTYMYYSGYYHPFKWLYLEGAYNPGEKIYYSAKDPYVGDGHFIQFKALVQAGEKWVLAAEFMNTVLNRKLNGKETRSYECNVFNAATSYMFNKYFFLRGALRYNSYTDILLTDFLASFTLIPGTVMHMGYGSLYNKSFFKNNDSVAVDSSLLNVKNSFFFKVSYLWRIK